LPADENKNLFAPGVFIFENPVLGRSWAVFVPAPLHPMIL
jgi:hypothetical protein